MKRENKNKITNSLLTPCTGDVPLKVLNTQQFVQSILTFIVWSSNFKSLGKYLAESQTLTWGKLQYYYFFLILILTNLMH